MHRVYTEPDDVVTKVELERGLVKLPDRQREAMTLSLDGYTQAETGEFLGVHRTTVLRDLRVARAKMRVFLEI